VFAGYRVNAAGRRLYKPVADFEVQSSSPNLLFWKTIFRPLRGAAFRNFYTRYGMTKVC